MEPRIFRFFQYIESILSNFIPGKELGAKTMVGRPFGKVAPPDRKETWTIQIGVYNPSQGHEVGLPGFASRIFFLFVGFVIGNLFGTFLPSIRIFFSWDGFIVLFLLFFIEFISYIRYQGKSRFFLILWNFRRVDEEGINFPLRADENPKETLKGEDGYINLTTLERSDEKIPQSAANYSRPEVTAAKKGKQNGKKIASSLQTKLLRGPKIAFSPLFSNEETTERWPGRVGYKSLNYFKIGFLLGFFIDAYKVGS